MSPSERWLVVNADDFGLSPGVNAGVARTFEDGVVRSASLMVRRPASAAAADYAHAHPGLGLGLHVDLGEWVYEAGAWYAEEIVVDPEDAASVGEEAQRQLDRFRALVGRDPTHLDSHQHVHRAEPAASVLSSLAHELGVPLRGAGPGVRWCGGFYGQTGHGEPLPDAISTEALIGLVQAVEPGVTELTCHPGLPPHSGAYAGERAREVQALCDPRVRAAIAAEGIRLGSFVDARAAPSG